MYFGQMYWIVNSNMLLYTKQKEVSYGTSIYAFSGRESKSTYFKL